MAGAAAGRALLAASAGVSPACPRFIGELRAGFRAADRRRRAGVPTAQDAPAPAAAPLRGASPRLSSLSRARRAEKAIVTRCVPMDRRPVPRFRAARAARASTRTPAGSRTIRRTRVPAGIEPCETHRTAGMGRIEVRFPAGIQWLCGDFPAVRRRVESILPAVLRRKLPSGV